MADVSKIQWTDSTFNPWEGCTKIGPGCDHCYAEARNHRFGGGNWGPGAPRRRTSEQNWRQPVKWNKEADAFFAEHGHRRRVFCASLADVFDNEVDPRWRADLFRLIYNTPELDWLLLTKRIGNAAAMIEQAITTAHLRTIGAIPWPWPNVWLGATIVNQDEAERDVAKLQDTPAAVHFISAEPLLGPLKLVSLARAEKSSREYDAYTFFDNCLTGFRAHKAGGWHVDPIDWVIVGGESGHGAREHHIEYTTDIVRQCQHEGVAVFVKQLGSKPVAGINGVQLVHPKGGDWDEWPESLRVREFPR